MLPSQIYESDDVIIYLGKHQITEQYQKAKKLLTSGHIQKYDFKIKKPKENGVFQFRINQKYRAFGYFKGDIFYVYKISDHQDF